jgi:hypothetical protein
MQAVFSNWIQLLIDSQSLFEEAYMVGGPLVEENINPDISIDTQEFTFLKKGEGVQGLDTSLPSQSGSSNTSVPSDTTKEDLDKKAEIVEASGKEDVESQRGQSVESQRSQSVESEGSFVHSESSFSEKKMFFPLNPDDLKEIWQKNRQYPNDPVITEAMDLLEGYIKRHPNYNRDSPLDGKSLEAIINYLKNQGFNSEDIRFALDQRVSIRKQYTFLLRDTLGNWFQSGTDSKGYRITGDRFIQDCMHDRNPNGLDEPPYAIIMKELSKYPEYSHTLNYRGDLNFHWTSVFLNEDNPNKLRYTVDDLRNSRVPNNSNFEQTNLREVKGFGGNFVESNVEESLRRFKYHTKEEYEKLGLKEKAQVAFELEKAKELEKSKQLERFKELEIAKELEKSKESSGESSLAKKRKFDESSSDESNLTKKRKLGESSSGE